MQDNTHLKSKSIIGYKDSYYIKIKGSLHQEEVTILSLYAPNKIALNYVQQKLIELLGEIDKPIIKAGDIRN